MSSFYGGGSGVTLASAAPMQEATAAAVGTDSTAARGLHIHPRLTSVGGGTLDANGEQTITFTRPFPMAAGFPHIDCNFIELTDNPPVTFKVKSYANDGTNYTGATIKGYRAQLLPSSIALLSVLVSFNVFAGNASGLPFTYIAVLPS